MEDEHTQLGNSHIEENNDQYKYFTYYTRKTGRFSNQIYEYVYWRLKAINDNVDFECTYGPLPEPFDKLPQKISEKKMKLENYDEKAPRLPNHMKYFLKHREFIVNLLNIQQYPLDVYDMVVHIRLDDVANGNNDYSLCPLNFYEFIEEDNVLIIGRPMDKGQENILEKVKEILFKKCRSVVIQKEGDISKDIISMMRTKKLVASISSFWFWPTFLSNNIEEVHVPNWKINKMADMCSWDKVVCHEVNINGDKIGSY